MNLVPGQVGDLSDQMRKTVKKMCHPTALVVDNEESDIVRTIIQRKRQHIGLQRFTLSGTGSSRNQAMRPVVLLMNVQIAILSAGLLTDQTPDVVISAVLDPPVRCSKIRRS